ncbi:MAG TPA: dimethylsulfonioproprionate lyase family protein [Magnetospirillum sp.]|nr:dimethylsulfonioproprionate lyase family protein [Magnetospirillum sp.]
MSTAAIDLGPLRDALVAELVRPPLSAGEAAREVARVAELVAAANGEQSPFDATHHPATRHLAEAVEGTRRYAPALAAALRPLAQALPWRYGYAPRADIPGLERDMAWAEIVGPAAPFRNSQVCLGLTLIGPHTHYPAHRHPAVEAYRVVNGTARWTAGDRAAPQQAGALILHPSELSHAMLTGAEPLLAVYSWTGDVDSPSIWENAA